MFLASIAVSMNQFKIPPLLPLLLTELNVDMVTAGWTMSVFSVSGLILSVPAAHIVARIGLKPVGQMALVCTILGSVAGALATSPAALLAGRAVEGVSLAFIGVVAPAAVTVWFVSEERGLPMGIWSTWVPVGTVAMFTLAEPIVAAVGWRGLWLFGAAFATVALLLFRWVVTGTDPRTSARASRPAEEEFSAARGRPPVATWLVAAALGAFAFSTISYSTWAPTFLMQTFQVGAGTASLVVGLFFLAQVPGNVCAGWLIVRTGYRYRVLAVAFAITGILLFWCFRLSSERLFVPYMLLLGFVSSFIPATAYTLAPETMVGRKAASLAPALLGTGSSLGVLIGPPMLAAAVRDAGWASVAATGILVAGMGVGLGATVSAWWQDPRRHVRPRSVAG